jgi:hypothetical protein
MRRCSCRSPSIQACTVLADDIVGKKASPATARATIRATAKTLDDDFELHVWRFGPEASAGALLADRFRIS